MRLKGKLDNGTNLTAAICCNILTFYFRVIQSNTTPCGLDCPSKLKLSFQSLNSCSNVSSNFLEVLSHICLGPFSDRSYLIIYVATFWHLFVLLFPSQCLLSRILCHEIDKFGVFHLFYSITSWRIVMILLITRQALDQFSWQLWYNNFLHM